MALSTSIIESALATNAAAGSTETQAMANARLAQAIVDTIKTLQITYTSGLVGVSPGSPIAGATLVATIS